MKLLFLSFKPILYTPCLVLGLKLCRPHFCFASCCYLLGSGNEDSGRTHKARGRRRNVLFFCGLVSISCSCEQHANNAFQPSRGSSFQGQNLNPVCNFSLPCRTHLNVLFQRHQHWSASTPSAEVWVSISLIPPLSL